MAKNGNDKNSGTAIQPWLTITKAANTMVAGDTVYVKGGVYKERVIPQNSGSQGKYITFAAYPGQSVTIDGTGISNPNYWDSLVKISGKKFIKFDGFKIENYAGGNGFAVYVTNNGATPSSDIVISNLKISNILSGGIIVEGFSNGKNYIITNNTLSNVQQRSYRDSLNVHECISIVGATGFTVRYNSVTNCDREGIDIKDGSSNGLVYGNFLINTHNGIYADAWDSGVNDIQIYNNRVDNSAQYGIQVGSEKGGTLQNILIFNNIVNYSYASGILINDYSFTQPAGRINNITISYNTVIQNGRDAGWSGGIAIDRKTNIQNIKVYNNIGSQNYHWQLRDLTSGSSVIGNNLIDGSNSGSGATNGINPKFGNPQFVSYPINLHLKSTSIARDIGTVNGLPGYDFDWKNRPYGNGYDIGSYEYVP